MGVLTNEEENSTSETRQRYTSGKECRHSESGGAPEGGDVSHLHTAFLLGLCLPLANYLVSALVNYLVSFFTPDWSMDPPQDACATK